MTMKHVSESMALQLRSARLDRGWSLQQAADRIGVTRQCVSQWEHGRKAFDVEDLALLIDVYERPLTYWLTSLAPKSNPAMVH